MEWEEKTQKKPSIRDDDGHLVDSEESTQLEQECDGT